MNRLNKFNSNSVRAAGAALACCAVFWASCPAEAFRVWTLPVITESLPTAGLGAHMHWDLREFPNCQVPFAFSSANMVDVNGDGNVNNADTTAASNAVNASLMAWTNVSPAIIGLTRQPAAAVANQPFRVDGFNVIGFGTNAGDDVADPAPVGANVGGNFFAIHPGPNGVINSVLNDSPAGAGPGDDLTFVSGGVTFVASGPNQIIETTPVGDDRWVTGINVGPNVRIINGGVNAQLETMPFTDDVASAAGAGSITTGPNGIVNSTPNNMNVTNTSTFGITAVLVNNTNGVIQEADITLNTTSMIADENGVMRPVPWVTTGQRFHNPFNATNAAGIAGLGFNKDIQATTTHELGHAIGISHPEETQLVAIGNGPWGRPGVTGAGVGGALSAASIANLAGDDEINGAMTLIFTGADGICQTMAAGGDAQTITVGMGAPGFPIGVLPASDGVLTTPIVPDDIPCVTGGLNAICVGPNGICNSGQAIGAIPTMNTNPNAFTGNAVQERSLAQDDQDACNFLYTWDLGDADDEFLAGGAFNEYQTRVQSTTNGRMLNGVQLLLVGQGPVHLLGYSRTGGSFRFEWLGANEDGAANEHAPLDEDMFDDGFTIEGVAPTAIGALGQGFELNRGGTYDMLVTVSHTNQAGRYAGGIAQQRLHFNGYFDWNTDQRFTSPDDLEIWWSGTPTATSSSSSNFVSATFQGAPNNRVILRFRVTVPEDAGSDTPFLFSRMRLDYGEDEGRQLDINGDNDPAEGVAQFGEVEDYLISLSDPPDQLHIGCLPEYMEPSIPLGQAGTIHAYVEQVFDGLGDQSVTFEQVGGTGLLEWPDGTLSDANPSYTTLTDSNGEAVVQVNDPEVSPGDVVVEVRVAGTTLKTYCLFDIGFFGGPRSSDLNGDGRVDTADLGILIGAFGSHDVVADINNDGVVDTADLGILVSLF